MTISAAGLGAIEDLNFAEIELVDGASAGEAILAGVAGMAASSRVAALAGVASGGSAGAAVLLGGFALGVALYYITD